MTDNYFKIVLSSEYDSIEDAVKYSTELTQECESKGNGVVILIVTQWTDMMVFPEHHTRYICNKGIENHLTFDWECDEDAYTEHYVTYPVEWIKKYNVENNTRLCIVYQHNCTKEQGEIILKGYEENTRPIEQQWKYLKEYKL